jgi:hypothetical protein
VPRLCEVYPGICLTTEEKSRKTLNQGSRRMPVWDTINETLCTYEYSAVVQNILYMLSLKITGLFLVYLTYFGIEAIVCTVRNWKNCANHNILYSLCKWQYIVQSVQIAIYCTRFHFHLYIVIKI